MAYSRMSQSARKFATPIKLNDGRKIVTLVDARDLMSPLRAGRQTDSDWMLATELLQFASTRDDRISAGRARAQLLKVLKLEGLA
jgi:hypothetical protein